MERSVFQISRFDGAIDTALHQPGLQERAMSIVGSASTKVGLLGDHNSSESAQPRDETGMGLCEHFTADSDVNVGTNDNLFGLDSHSLTMLS